MNPGLGVRLRSTASKTCSTREGDGEARTGLLVA